MGSSGQEEEDDDILKVKAIVGERLLSFCTISRGLSPPRIRIRWTPPPLGHYKLNTDGSCRPNKDPSSSDYTMHGPGGFGGILRDHLGYWVRGFQGFLDTSDFLTTELWAIYHGLKLLDELGLKESVLESDSAAAIKWIINPNSHCNRNSQIIKDCWRVITECKRLILKNKIAVNWASRQANKCAHKLANMAIEKEAEPLLVIINIPDEIKHILDFESRGSSSTRCGQKNNELLPVSQLLL